MKYFLALLTFLVLTSISDLTLAAPPSFNSDVCSTCDVSQTTSIATNGTTPRTLAARAADVINVKDGCNGSPGAVGDNVTDDTVAINACLNEFRTLADANSTSGATELLFPQGTYLVTAPLNFTNIRSPYATVVMTGASIDADYTSATAGENVIDAFYSAGLTFDHLSVETSGTYAPGTGVAIGTINNVVADQMRFLFPTVEGNYSVCAFYNRNSETSLFLRARIGNTSPTGYVECQDGINHLNVQSTFQTVTRTQDTAQSFNENTWITPDFRNSGGGPGVFLSYTSRHRFIGGYIGDTNGTGTNCGLTLYFANGQPSGNQYLWWDVHEETTTISDYVCIAGNSTGVNIPDLTIMDQNPNASRSLFNITGSETWVDLQNTTIDIGGYSSTFQGVFLQPNDWTVTGKVDVPIYPKMWNLPDGAFQGTFSTLNSLSYTGDGGSLSLSSVNTSGTIDPSSGVQSITPGGSCWKITGGGTTFPNVRITPPSSGTPAYATITAMSLACQNPSGFIASGGSGYVSADVGSIVTMIGGTCSIPPEMKIATVTSGAVTSLTPLQTGQCSVLPAQPILWSGGTGTGVSTQNQGWAPNTYAIDSGSGYTTAPTASLVGAYLNNMSFVSGTLSLTTQIGGPLILGSSGTTGSSVTAAGALNDNSTVFVSSVTSGATQVQAANTDGLYLENSSNIGSQIIELPPISGVSGQTDWVSTLGGISSVTFKTSTGGVIASSPTFMNVGTSVKFISDGTIWHLQSVGFQSNGSLYLPGSIDSRTMEAFGSLNSSLWQNQGAYFGWNYQSGTGETDFINSRGGGGGGFNFYNTTSSSSATPALLANLNPSGNLTLEGSGTSSSGVLTYASQGTTQSLLSAIPSSSTPWSDNVASNVYFGRTLPNTSATGYLGMPYGPQVNGLSLQNANITIIGTTYGWSGSWENDNLLNVQSGDFATSNQTLFGAQGYADYANRLVYGEADSHTVNFQNAGRGVQLTLTGLTAANFTTDPAIVDPATGNPIYRITFAASNVSAGYLITAGQLPSSAAMGQLKAGDTVFTSNGFMAFIVKADPNGTWVDVDNWTRGAGNFASCANEGPSVQPSGAFGCAADIGTGGVTSLTAYIGTETTFEPMYLVNWFPKNTVNPIAQTAGGIEFNTSDQSTIPINYNINQPLADKPLTSEIYASPDEWGNGILWEGGIYRAFVVGTTQLKTAAGTATVQPLCGLCITQGSTVQDAILDDRASTTGNILYSDTGSSSQVTSLITKTGSAAFEDMSIIGNLGPGLPSLSLSGNINKGLIGWNYSNGQEEIDFINMLANPAQSFGWAQNTGSTYSDLMTLFPNGNLLASGGFSTPVGVAAQSYTVSGTAGASCSGTPSSSFQVLNGIVTHC